MKNTVLLLVFIHLCGCSFAQQTPVNNAGRLVGPCYGFISSAGDTGVWYWNRTQVAAAIAAAGGGSGTVTSITAGTGLTGGTITTSGTIGIDTTKIDYCVYNSGRLAAQTGSLTLTYTPTVALGNYRLVFFLNARNNGTTAGTVTYTNGAGTLQSLIPMQRARNQTIPFTLAWTSGEGQTYPVIFSATNATPITIVITAAAADYDAQFWIYKMPN